MAKRLFNIAITAIIALLTSSCTEEIDLELDEMDPILIVDGQFTTDTVRQIVRLTKSRSVLSNELPLPVLGATVQISDGNQTFTLIDTASNGHYYTPTRVPGEVGKTYTLTVSDVDINDDGKNETYSAKETILPILNLDSIAVAFGVRADTGMSFQIWVQEPPEQNFYMFRGFVNGVLSTLSPLDWDYQSDEVYNGNYLSGAAVLYIPVFTNIPPIEPGQLATMETNHISETYFDFINQFNQDKNQNPLFGGPPANIVTNMNNGARGYFAAYSSSYMTTVIPPYEEWRFLY